MRESRKWLDGYTIPTLMWTPSQSRVGRATGTGCRLFRVDNTSQRCSIILGNDFDKLSLSHDTRVAQPGHLSYHCHTKLDLQNQDAQPHHKPTRRPLVASGGVRVASGASGTVWESLGASGSVREPLGASGSLWERLGASGGVWEPLGASGGPWEPLGASGRLEEPLGASGSLGATIAPQDQPWHVALQQLRREHMYVCVLRKYK